MLLRVPSLRKTTKTEMLAIFKMYPEVVLASQQISAIERQRNAKIKPLYRIPGRTTINEYEITEDQKKKKEQMFQLSHKMSRTENSE
ncbi:hypothetical protein K5549_005305 [Capra hircus]|uniref:Uncharacterized protein n=1 Tax=Capra hircus TaxID=9925 RepID=A0A452EPZ5_CAPHI|nr:hypothetical protein K5549_005305 [Capra hircus]